MVPGNWRQRHGLVIRLTLHMSRQEDNQQHMGIELLRKSSSGSAKLVHEEEFSENLGRDD